MIRPDIVGKDFKILIRSPEHSKRVQEALFELGYSWYGSSKIEHNKGLEVLWVEKNSKYLAWSNLRYANDPTGNYYSTPWYNERSIKFNVKSKVL